MVVLRIKRAYTDGLRYKDTDSWSFRKMKPRRLSNIILPCYRVVDIAKVDVEFTADIRKSNIPQYILNPSRTGVFSWHQQEETHEVLRFVVGATWKGDTMRASNFNAT